MQKQLEAIIDRYNNSQSSLEAYEAIFDFVEIIKTMPDFIKQVEDEAEKIRIERIKVEIDKGWTDGLRGRDLTEHNKKRDQKYNILRQRDPLRLLSELEFVHENIQSQNIGNSELLFSKFCPDDPLPESDKKSYQSHIDKLYKKALPFLKSEEVEQFQEVTKVKSYNEETQTLNIGKYQIKIAKNKGNNNAHEIMAYIFIDKKADLAIEFFYADIAEQRFEADYDAEDKNAQQPYSGACKRINQTVKDETNGEVKDFLIYNHSKLGSVRINPKYL